MGTFNLHADFRDIDGGGTHTKRVQISSNTQVLGDDGVIFDHATVDLVNGVLDVDLPASDSDPGDFGYVITRPGGVTKRWQVPAQAPDAAVELADFTATTPLPMPMPDVYVQLVAGLSGQVTAQALADALDVATHDELDAVSADAGEALTAVNLLGRASRPVALNSDPNTQREYPLLRKAQTAPIMSYGDAGQPLASIYYPTLINRLPQTGTEQYALMWSTDHETTHANSGMALAFASTPFGPWTQQGKVFRDDTAGTSQTETPTVLWDEGTGLWHMYYSQQGTNQFTRLATSPDLITWTIVGTVLNRPPGMPGNGDVTYARVFRYSGYWYAVSNAGGTSFGGQTLSYSQDGITWQVDSRRLGYSDEKIKDIPGYVESYRLKWTGPVIDWRGRPTVLASVGPTSAGGVENVVNYLCTAPFSPDFRGVAGKVVNIHPTLGSTGQWDQDGLEGISNAVVYGGRPVIVYRSGGKQGSFGLLEVY